ncbi:MAG: cyclophilin-like fold protein [Desulfohalobiaceae bacterium]
MSRPIVIDLGKVQLHGELMDNEAGRKLAEMLPFSADMGRWGEELYGPMEPAVGTIGSETQEVMDLGDLAYHDDTGWFCIFWGPTPSSNGDEIRAAFPVQKVGTADGDFDAVAALSPPVGATIRAAG